MRATLKAARSKCGASLVPSSERAMRRRSAPDAIDDQTATRTPETRSPRARSFFLAGRIVELQFVHSAGMHGSRAGRCVEDDASESRAVRLADDGQAGEKLVRAAD